MNLEKIKTLIRNHDMCVLATLGKDGPHTSLMAYTCAGDCDQLYMLTSIQTLKFKNLTEDNRVSLLVDTREKDARESIKAVTITGRAYQIIDADEVEQLQYQIRKQLPHLHGLLDQPELAFVRVCIESFQVLDGVQDAHYVSVKDETLYPSVSSPGPIRGNS